MKKVSLLMLCFFMFFVITACGDLCDHEWSEWETTKVATCVNNGREEHTCSLCDKTESRVVQKLGHFFGDVYAKSETEHYHICNICGVEESHGLHTPDNANDLGNVHCSVCSYLLEEKKDTFYDHLLEVGSCYVVELENFKIENTYNYDLVFVSESTETIIVNGKAYFVESDAGYNVLIKGNGSYKYENQNGEIESSLHDLELYFDGSTVYGVMVEEEDDEVRVLPAKQFISNINSISDLLMSIDAFDYSVIFASEIVPQILIKLFNKSSNELVKTVVDFLFVKEEVEEGYELKLDLSKVIDLLEELNDKNIVEIVESFFGEGKFESTKNNMYRLLDTQLSTLFRVLKAKYDIDIKQVLIEFAEKYNLKPEDLKDMFEDEVLMNMTIYEAFFQESGMSKQEIIDSIEEGLSEIIDIEFSLLQVVEVINSVNEQIEFIIHTDKEGYIESLTFDFNFDLIEDSLLEGMVTIKEYNDMEEFETLKQELLTHYSETIPTIDLSEAVFEEGTNLKVEEYTLTIDQRKEYTKYSYINRQNNK